MNLNSEESRHFLKSIIPPLGLSGEFSYSRWFQIEIVDQVESYSLPSLSTRFIQKPREFLYVPMRSKTSLKLSFFPAVLFGTSELCP